MATDNVTRNATSGGEVVSTDLAGGAQYQRVKLTDGTADSEVVIAAAAGTAATALRVTLASDDPGVALLTTMDADTGAIKTAVELIDNTVYVEDVATPATISGTAVVMERDDALGGLTPAEGDWAALRCDANGALWTHDDALDAAVSGSELQVDVVAEIPAGTQIIGSVKITDGTEVADILGSSASDAEATSPKPLNTASFNYSFNGATWDRIRSGAGAVAAGVQRVTLASDDPGVALLATIDADTNNILTAVQIMDDWDAVHDSAASSDGPQLMAAYDSTKPTAVADGDAVRLLADAYGRPLIGLEPEWFNAIYNSADATGEGETVKAKTASKKIYITSYIISSDVETWVELQDEDSNAITPKYWLKAGGGVSHTCDKGVPLVLNVANKDLEVITEAAGNIGVAINGYLAP